MNFSLPQEQEEASIELTPLIDVVFLLLIFFMISTTFTKETKLEINLPDAKGQVTTEQAASIEVQIGANSEYAISTSDTDVARTLINSNRDTLLRALSEHTNQPDRLLIIRADKSATHQAVMKVLDVAKQLELNNITFAAKQSSE